MEPGFNIGVKSAESRKKKKGGVLEDNIGNKKFIAAKVSSSYFWDSKTGNTTKSDSVDMEEECLVEEISFNHGDDKAFAGENLEQTPKSLKILIKKILGKPLKKINFLDDDINDIFLDKPVVFPPSFKNLVNVSVKKSFTLNINLENIVGKSAQKKLVVVRKLFSKINGFGEASTPSKFAGIVRAMFTSELSLAQASKKAKNAKILVNSNLKRLSGHSNRAVVLKKILVGTSTKAVHAVLSGFGIVMLIKIQLVGLWQKAIVEFNKNYIGSVDRKTCAIDYYPVTYAQTRCAVVCFESVNSLNAVMRTTLVLRGVNMHWSLLSFSKYAKYGRLGHISLGCAVDENLSSGKPSCKPFLDMDKSRLAIIYAKHSAPIAYSIAFMSINSSSSLEMKPTLSDMSNVEKRFAVLKSSLASLAGQISELAKRLDSFMPAVFQSSPGCQLLMTTPSQNWMGNVVMGENLGKTTSGKTAMTLDSSAFPEVKRLKNMLERLFALVLSLIAKFDGLILAGSKIATYNIRGLNNPVKQDDVICWHKEMNNLIFIVTKTKLRGKICPWIMNKFNGIQVFTFGLNSGHLGSGIGIIMDNSLNNLSVSILGLYAGALLVVWFFQTGKINSLIAKAVNKSSFVILDGDFNENRAQKCASFKKCFDLGLVNSLRENGSVANIKDYFNTNHKAVSASMSLGGLFNIYLSSIHKQANKNCWKFDVKSADKAIWSEFKDATTVNAAMFLDKFESAKKFSDLNAM
ncbi:hypothetical protein G9A89_011268 [Geosiphon pyriformis]|nr:hypothetical protein G9A89_011268 [Geosiphon pyriformis]